MALRVRGLREVERVQALARSRGYAVRSGSDQESPGRRALESDLVS
jgi:hypothetical protein